MPKPDFGISASCLKRWLVIDDRKSTSRSAAGRVVSESDALREANKRIKLLEQENEVLRRAAAHLSQAQLPGIDASMPVVKGCQVRGGHCA